MGHLRVALSFYGSSSQNSICRMPTSNLPPPSLSSTHIFFLSACCGTSMTVQRRGTLSHQGTRTLSPATGLFLVLTFIQGIDSNLCDDVGFGEREGSDGVKQIQVRQAVPAKD